MFKEIASASADAIEIILLQEKLPTKKHKQLVKTVEALLQSGAYRGMERLLEQQKEMLVDREKANERADARQPRYSSNHMQRITSTCATVVLREMGYRKPRKSRHK